jgi:hypothetical protein
MMAVFVSFKMTLAFATTAPVGSRTVPETAPTIRNCAQALGASKIVSANSPVTFKHAPGFFAHGFITKPPSEMGLQGAAPIEQLDGEWLAGASPPLVISIPASSIGALCF